MNMHTTPNAESSPRNALEQRLARLERTNGRWRLATAAVSLLLIGGIAGGFVTQQPERNPFAEPAGVSYVASDDSIYRIYPDGRIEYLRVEDNPPHSAQGVYNWGPVKIDRTRALRGRPQG